MDRTLGIKVRKIRELRNFSQDYVADKLSLSQSYYSDLENGKKPVSEDKLNQIAKIFEVEPEIIKEFNDHVIFNSCAQSGYINTNNINPLDQVIELYTKLTHSKDERIKDLQNIIKEKNEIIENLKSKKS
jgi:transcriptional regulator with XRE-family HTH domain